MIKKITTCLTAVGLIAVAPSASALLISETGTLDTIIAMTDLPDSGEHTEKAWIASVLGMDVGDMYVKLDGSSSGSSWEAVTDDGNAGTYAFDLGADSHILYYLVKVGNGVGDYSNYLVENNDAFRYAYLDITEMGLASGNILAISHVSVVPEPATLSLLGAGLMAMGLMGRRRRQLS